MYRPLWREEILGEVGRVLHEQLGYSQQQSARRIEFMRQAFPEAAIAAPPGFHESLTGIPDKDDRHVLGAAICGHANVIVTRNTKHFPKDTVQPFDILCQTPDDFLIHQFHLNPAQILEKLDAQASGIRKSRPEILSLLRVMVPNFVSLIEKWT